MDSSSSNKNSDLLKAEGNAFHQAHKFKEAYAKYSEAIKQDPKNAVLWANRAASALAMKKYLDANTDAEKATELDPKYAKAWGRQGTANLSLGNWTKSVTAFKKALGSLPSSGNLSKADQILKTQFEDGLKKAEEILSKKIALEDIATSIPEGSATLTNLPWKRAVAMENDLMSRRQFQSSAFLIAAAYKEFQRGLDDMKLLVMKEINGQQAMFGKTCVIESLTNAILRDRRVFQMDSEFLDKYNRQMIFEIHQTKAWTTGGPKLVQEEALKRLRELGWGAVRPALAVTVRGWIMRGFLQASLQLPGGGTSFFSDALQILEWGARIWKAVPEANRGTIFEATFIRGVKRLYLNFLMESYSRTEVDLENVANLARKILDEQLPPPVGEIDPGFMSSFWIYPEADAHVNLAWYYLKKGQAAYSFEEGTELCKESARHYMKGANLYPRDDEKHVMFLKIALEAHWYAESSLKITLPIAKQIREAIPEMLRIWEFSPDTKYRDEWMQQVLSFEKDCIAGLEAGKITLDASGAPKGMTRLV